MSNHEQDAAIRAAIISQFTAALEMMRQVIAKCPDELWLSMSMRNQFWRVAYHALFFVDLYLQDSKQSFVPWGETQGCR
jgi:hypothetical protein